MKKEKVNNFVGKLVELTFKESWFNEAMQKWVDEDEKFIGILKHCENRTQKHLYYLDNYKIPTHNACWSANRIRTIKEVLL